MNFADYQALRAINWSTLKEMRASPLAYRYRLDVPREDTPALALGRLTHAMVFEPETLNQDFAIWEGGVRRGKEWDAFVAANPGKTLFRVDEVDTATAMADAVRRHPLVQPYLDGGIFEATVTWDDPHTGLACKGRPDWLIPDSRILLDLKTTRSIEGRRFGSSAASFGYHCQLAFYRAGVAASLGWEPKRVLIVAVEKDAPYDVGVFELDDDTLYAGEEEVRELLGRVRQCVLKDQWPGRYEDEQALQLPAWLFEGDDEGGIDLEIGVQ